MPNSQTDRRVSISNRYQKGFARLRYLISRVSFCPPFFPPRGFSHFASHSRFTLVTRTCMCVSVFFFFCFISVSGASIAQGDFDESTATSVINFFPRWHVSTWLCRAVVDSSRIILAAREARFLRPDGNARANARNYWWRTLSRALSLFLSLSWIQGGFNEATFYGRFTSFDKYVICFNTFRVHPTVNFSFEIHMEFSKL